MLYGPYEQARVCVVIKIEIAKNQIKTHNRFNKRHYQYRQRIEKNTV